MPKVFKLLAFCEGNPPAIGGIPSQRASNAHVITSSWFRYQVVWAWLPALPVPVGTSAPLPAWAIRQDHVSLATTAPPRTTSPPAVRPTSSVLQVSEMCPSWFARTCNCVCIMTAYITVKFNTIFHTAQQWQNEKIDKIQTHKSYIRGAPYIRGASYIRDLTVYQSASPYRSHVSWWISAAPGMPSRRISTQRGPAHM